MSHGNLTSARTSIGFPCLGLGRRLEKTNFEEFSAFVWTCGWKPPTKRVQYRFITTNFISSFTQLSQPIGGVGCWKTAPLFMRIIHRYLGGFGFCNFFFGSAARDRKADKENVASQVLGRSQFWMYIIVKIFIEDVLKKNWRCTEGWIEDV